MTCLGASYATRHVREWNRKNAQKARKLQKAGDAEAGQALLLGQIGYKATMKKDRYTDQKPPPTPQKNPRGGKRA